MQIGHVDFSFTSSLRPWDHDPEQYWTEITGKIMVLPDEAADDDPPELAGEIRLLLVRVAEARDDEVSLFFVFDSYDQALHEIYCALFDADEEVRTDLDLEPFVHEILVVESLKVEPRYEGTGLGAQAIHSAASLLVTMGLVVADAEIPLTLDDWKSLGFVRIAGEPGLHVLDRTRKNPYGHSN